MISILTIFISVVGIIISVLVYYNSQKQYKLNQKSFEDQHDYNRRLCSLNLIEKWDSDTLKSRTCLMNKWKERFTSDNPIPYDEIKKFRDEQLKLASDSSIAFNEITTVTEHIQIILNYFENIALAIDNKIADEDVLKEAFRNTFERWFYLLGDYKRTIGVYRKFDPWEPLESLFERWFPDKKKPKVKVPKPKTGQVG